MICSHCKTNIELVDSNGWPLYYFGAGPNSLQDAKVYFCWAGCATNYQKENKDEFSISKRL